MSAAVASTALSKASSDTSGDPRPCVRTSGAALQASDAQLRPKRLTPLPATADRLPASNAPLPEASQSTPNGSPVSVTCAPFRTSMSPPLLQASKTVGGALSDAAVKSGPSPLPAAGALQPAGSEVQEDGSDPAGHTSDHAMRCGTISTYGESAMRTPALNADKTIQDTMTRNIQDSVTTQKSSNLKISMMISGLRSLT